MKHGTRYNQAHPCRLPNGVSSDQNEISDITNDKNLESVPVITTNNAVFDTDSSEDEQSTMCDDIDIMNTRDFKRFLLGT